MESDGIATRATGESALLAPRPASGALTKTSGFLCGYSHTLQPYIGCTYGCSYCYVQRLPLHFFHQPVGAWGEYAHPRTGIAERLRAELASHARRGRLDSLSIFMSSVTDPYQPAERSRRLARACLQVMLELPPGLIVVQTRSPLVREDFDLLAAMGDRAWLSVTLETDREEVRRAQTPRCPSLAQRVALLEGARRRGLNVQVAVSPCLPYSSAEGFAALLAGLAGDCGRVVVDSYVAGDGQGGRRTAATRVPATHELHGWPDWRDESDARALHARLCEALGGRAGWSHDGFAALPALALQRTPSVRARPGRSADEEAA